MTSRTPPRWGDLLQIVQDAPGCNLARLQSGYPAADEIWDTLPVTIAVYALRGGGYWHVMITCIAANGLARAGLVSAFFDSDGATEGVRRLTDAIYNRN